jgi:hypothetical protein
MTSRIGDRLKVYGQDISVCEYGHEECSTRRRGPCSLDQLICQCNQVIAKRDWSGRLRCQNCARRIAR